MRYLWFSLIALVCGMLVSTTAIKSLIFDINCESYLKSAADAPTVELAATELDIAINWFTEHYPTEGYSCFIFKKRDQDVGNWYRRLVAARSDLDTITEDSSGLERSNMLMKLRETLLDGSNTGDKVTLPLNIAIFPHQWLWSCLFFVGAFIGCICILILFGRLTN